MNAATVFAAVFAALYAAHQVADHWTQTHNQATAKGAPGWAGRRACAAHVATYTATAAVFLTATCAVTGLHLAPARTAVALAVNAVSHYWADRRFTLARFAELIGKGDYYRLGAPREGHDDNPTLGTGAYALDQSWHVVWLFIAALAAAGGAA